MLSIAEIIDCMKFAITFVGVLIGHALVPASETSEPLYLENNRSTNHSIQICEKDSCKHAAEAMLGAMDVTVNPCDDFFNYTCNNWIRTNPIPEHKSSRTIVWDLNDPLQDSLYEVLNSSTQTDNSTSKALAKRFFQMCIDEVSIDAEKTTTINRALSESLGSWPIITSNWTPESFDLLGSLRTLRSNFSIGPLLDFSVSTSMKNTSSMAIFVSISSGFTKDMMQSSLASAYVESYATLITNTTEYMLAESTSLVPDPGLVKQDVEGILEWFTFLANISKTAVENRDPQTVYTAMTFADLEDKYFRHSTLAKGFLELVKDAFVDVNISSTFDKDLEIYVHNPASFAALDERLVSLETHPNMKRSLANYLGWALISGYQQALPKIIRDFFLAHGLTFTGASKPEPRWKECLSTTSEYFPWQVGAIYVDHVVDPRSKNATKQIVTDLKASFREILTKTTWMQKKTQTAALKKLEEMLEYELYPDFFHNLTKLDAEFAEFRTGSTFFETLKSLNSEKQAKNLHELAAPPSRVEKFQDVETAAVNAFFAPSSNGIGILAGIAQYPLLDPSLPDYINYARIGSVIGHEITHAFDDQGSQYDEQGNLANWWQDTDRKKYEEKASGIAAQYGNYETGVGHVNGNLTLGENIADNGGVHAALMAYRARKRTKAAVNADPMLPGFEGHTEEMLFFQSFAYVWCGYMRPEQEKLQLMEDPHSPERFRVNGVVSNSVDFATAFKCSSKSSMNPARKQGVW